MEIWAGRPPLEFKPRFSLEEAIQMAEEKSRVYTDAHCWVFEPESFRRCITDLVSATMIEAGVDLIRDTQPGTHEFWAILTHPKMSFRPLETVK